LKQNPIKWLLITDAGDRLVMLGFVALTERKIEDGIARLALALHDVIQTHAAPRCS